MRRQHTENRHERGVSDLIEFVLISGIVTALMIVLMFTINAHLMEGPADQISYAAFTDIGNGLSTRIVDVYVIAPVNGTISTAFDIPDDVATREYFVEIGSAPGSSDQVVEVYGTSVKSTISLAGIGLTKGVTGNTTGMGMNRITYNSEGV